MAGAGIRALAGEKPMGNKALSAFVTARTEQAEMLAKAPHPSMIAGLREHLAKHFPEAGKGDGATAAKLVTGTIMAPAAGPRPLTASQKITSGAKGSDSQKITAGSLPASPATGAHPASGPAKELPQLVKAPIGGQPKASPAAKQPIDKHVGITIRGKDAGAPVEVRVLGRKGEMFMHTSQDGKGFGVTHGPSRRLVAEVESKVQARALMAGMSKGKTFERAMAGDARAIAAGNKYIARIKAMKPAVKPVKPVKPPSEPRGAKGHAEKSDGSGKGHGGKIPKADFSGVVAPFKAAAGIFPSMIQHGIATAQVLSGLAAITAKTHAGRR